MTLPMFRLQHNHWLCMVITSISYQVMKSPAHIGRRNNNLSGVQMTNAIVLATALLCACFSTSVAYSDSDILNFALNLECLEAEYYSWAAFGEGLTSEQRGGGPPSIGGMKANLGIYQVRAGI